MPRLPISRHGHASPPGRRQGTGPGTRAKVAVDGLNRSTILQITTPEGGDQYATGR